MNSIKTQMAAQIPSDVRMPMSGHASCASTIRTAGTAVVLRERTGIVAPTAGTTDGDLGLAQSYFPGTSAWRPPTC